MVEPARMGEVTGAEQGDALALRPPGEVVELEVPAARAGVPRVDVKIGDPGERRRTHPGHLAASAPPTPCTRRVARAPAVPPSGRCGFPWSGGAQLDQGDIRLRADPDRRPPEPGAVRDVDRHAVDRPESTDHRLATGPHDELEREHLPTVRMPRQLQVD